MAVGQSQFFFKVDGTGPSINSRRTKASWVAGYADSAGSIDRMHGFGWGVKRTCLTHVEKWITEMNGSGCLVREISVDVLTSGAEDTGGSVVILVLSDNHPVFTRTKNCVWKIQVEARICKA